VRIGVVGGGPCGRDARSNDARLWLLPGQRSLSSACSGKVDTGFPNRTRAKLKPTRRLTRGIQFYLLTLLLVVATPIDLRAQPQVPSQSNPPPIAATAISCHGAQQPRQIAELLFGRDVGHRLGVSESAFARFVAREITPRFPDGLTISDATGQWRDRGAAVITREPSKRVEIVLPGAADDESKLDAIVAAYKRRFHQHSVAVILRPACVSF
jgi:Protein of unknown function (DUF3574)